MQPHPIPQNVTSFQFHLIGDMTLKQFLYLATGAGIAYFLFVFLAASYPLVAWPLIIISASAGIAFAFLPFGSRPLDYWFVSFIKAIYSPTKRVWKKNGKTFEEAPFFGSRLIMYLSSLPKMGTPSQEVVQPKPQFQEEKMLIAHPFPQTTPSLPPLPPSKSTPPELPTTDELGKTVDLARQAQNLKFRIIQSERALHQIKTEAQRPHAIPINYTQQVNRIMADLQTLVDQASEIKSQLDEVTKTEAEKAIVPVLPVQLKEKIKVIIPPKAERTQLALTTFPNVINGVVKDKSGNYLESVVAVIYDKEGLPVRALKTNKLGQFSGSTPLSNDTYTLELEKDGFTFDVLQVELGGEVLPPLLITAK